MFEYNALTPEITEKLRSIVGERRFSFGEEVKEDYSHDEMPIYGKYLPEAVCLVKTTEEISEIMKICNDVYIECHCVSRTFSRTRTLYYNYS